MKYINFLIMFITGVAVAAPPTATTVSTPDLSGLGNIPDISGVPDVSVPTVSTPDIEAPDMSALKGLDPATMASLAKIPNFQLKLGSIAKLNLPDLSASLKGVSNMPGVIDNLDGLSKLPDIASLKVDSHLKNIVNLSELNIPMPQLTNLIKGANLDNLSIPDFIAQLPQNKFTDFMDSLKPPANKKDLVNQLKNLKTQLGVQKGKLDKARQQLQSFDAGKYDPTPATDTAELQKLKAELKTVKDAITLDSKKIPALEKAIKDGTADIDRKNEWLQGLLKKNQTDLNIISVDVGYNLLGAMSGTDVFKADVVVEISGKKHSVSVDLNVKDAKKSASLLAEKIKALI